MVQVRATDRDIGINSVLSYYITEGNEDMTFRMDRISGEITTRPAPPDRERQSFYHLVVTVEDEGTPTLSVSKWVAAGWGLRVRGTNGRGGVPCSRRTLNSSFVVPLGRRPVSINGGPPVQSWC